MKFRCPIKAPYAIVLFFIIPILLKPTDKRRQFIANTLVTSNELTVEICKNCFLRLQCEVNRTSSNEGFMVGIELSRHSFKNLV
jgi:hypothetical protein